MRDSKKGCVEKMNKAALLHIPSSEMSYYENKNELHLQLRTARNDVLGVRVLVGNTDTTAWKYEDFIMYKIFTTKYHDYWGVTIGLSANEAQYVFKITDSNGVVNLYDAQRLCEDTPENLSSPHGFWIESEELRPVVHIPEWVTKTVWYQIEIDRFMNSDGKLDSVNTLKWGEVTEDLQAQYGGDISGIIAKLDYLQNLGINGIILSPIFTGEGGLKVTATDFYGIDKHFGDKDTFKMLVDSLHHRNMKVILTANITYLSDNSRQWRDVLEAGADSQYVKWFDIKGFPPKYSQDKDNPQLARANYKFSNNNPHYPTLNLNNREVQDYFLQVIEYWVKHFNLDGLILNSATNLNRVFIAKLSKKIKKLKPNFYLTGRCDKNASTLRKLENLDAVEDNSLVSLLLKFVHDNSMLASEFQYQLGQQMLGQNSKKNRVRLNSLDNFLSPRILTLCNENKTMMRALMAFMYLQKGSPVITYGTEIGFSGHDFPSNLNCMNWSKDDQDEKMMRFVKVLNNFRIQNTKLISEGNFEWGQSSDKYDYISFIIRKDNRRLFSLFNFGSNNIKFVLPQSSKLILGQNIIDEKSEIEQYGFVIIEG